MKVKWGSIITDGEGKLGGHVYSHNHWGAFVRTLVTPTLVTNAYTTAVRNHFLLQLNNWKALTAAQQDAWTAFAGRHGRTDYFGTVYYLTGQTAFISCNMNMFAIGQADFVSPGTDDVPTVDLTGSVNSTASTSKLNYVIDGNPTNSNVVIIAFATALLSTGINVVTTQLRQITTIALTGANPYNKGAAWVTKYGAFSAGQKIFVRLRQIDKRSGLAGVDVDHQCVVV